MIWALLEILVPLLLALGLGVFIGWLLFRWRRRLLHASEWNQLAATAQRAEADLASARAAHEETRNEGTLFASRLAAANTEIETATSDLATAARTSESLSRDIAARDAVVTTLRADLDRVNAELSNAQANTTAALAATHSTESDGRVAELETSLAASRTELDASQSRLADLEATLLAERGKHPNPDNRPTRST